MATMSAFVLAANLLHVLCVFPNNEACGTKKAALKTYYIAWLYLAQPTFLNNFFFDSGEHRIDRNMLLWLKTS